MVRTGHQRDLLGQEIVDFDERVDMERLKRERLARLQKQMAKANLGGMLFFDPVNIRYATGRRFPGVFGMRFFSQYAIVPQEGTPLVFGNHNEDGSYAMEKGTFWDFFPCGRNVEEASRLWGDRLVDSMKELGIAGERLGIDRMDFYCSESLKAHEIEIADGRIPIERARSIKTEDEVSLIRQACAIADIAICAVRDAIEPGVTENELFAIMTQTNLKHGGEHMDARLLTAGGNTNPWTGNSTDRIVRPGDLVAMDTDMAGPMGYFADISRTYLCGDGKPNPEQLESYKRAYEFLYKSIPLFTVGASFQEIAEKVPEIPDEYRANRYSVLAHGVGMSDEWPALYFTDTSTTGFGNVPGVLEENMFMTMEASFGKENGREQVKLEEQLLITANGPEIISQAPFDWRFLD